MHDLCVALLVAYEYGLLYPYRGVPPVGLIRSPSHDLNGLRNTWISTAC